MVGFAEFYPFHRISSFIDLLLHSEDITLLNRLPYSSWAEDGEEISTASQ